MDMLLWRWIIGFAVTQFCLTVIIVGVTDATGVQEICENSVFEATCNTNEVVLITHARYGRMHEGRCITGEHSTTNCHTDARPYLDELCSGRRSCAVTVATLIPEKEQPCSRDLRSYLEVVYECVKVVNASRSYCQSSDAVEVREQDGYLSSLVTMETKCGSLDSPWWVTVEPGQNITLTLLDFGARQKGSQLSAASSVCHVFAVIKEQGANQPTDTVCAGSVRERRVMTSSTNRLEVRLVTRSEHTDIKDVYFLFHFQANGCANIPKPQNGWVDRTGNDVVIGCEGENKGTYRLQCRGTKWIGDYQNCSAALPVHSGSNTDPRLGFLKQKNGLWVVVILAIAVTVGLCILAAGLIHIKRKRRTPDARPDLTRPTHEVPYGQGDSHEKTVPRPNYNKTGDSTELYHSSENAYYRTWQMQRHAPQQMAPLPALPSGVARMSPQFGAHAHTAACSTHSAVPESGAYQRSTQSANEHIYESPKFDRKDYSSDEYELDAVNSEYFELDPDPNKMT